MGKYDDLLKPELRPGKRTCQCGLCGLFFSAPATFDRHLTGPIEDTRCRTPKEMRAIGLEPNPFGVWLDRRKKGKAVKAKQAA